MIVRVRMAARETHRFGLLVDRQKRSSETREVRLRVKGVQRLCRSSIIQNVF